MTKVLECSKLGDARFSPEYAKVRFFGREETIETFYEECQKNKRNLTRKGTEPFDHIVVQSRKLPPSDLKYYLTILWIAYLDQNPEFIQVLQEYDRYTDMFNGVYILDSQAEILTRYKEEGRSVLIKECEPFLKKIRN